ncbi:MAG: tRNA-modifying protein YgfZ [Pseudonocardiales bacterium]|nr:tRNA-modifying protein YgfZ [Pseudonocardiales bacterium]
MTDYRSALLDWPGAVEAAAPDAGTAWHYGDPLGEQRRAVETAVLIDRSNRDVLVVPGPDRLDWLHAIISQHVARLAEGDSAESLVLSPNGHVEQHWSLTELAFGPERPALTPAAPAVWIDTEPGTADEVLGYLLKMRFLKRVEPAVVTADFAVLSVIGPRTATVLEAAGLPVPASNDKKAVPLPDVAGVGFVRPRGDGGVDLIVQRPRLQELATRLAEAGAVPAGSWAAAALRIERRQPRLGLDTDHRTLPHEVGWIGSAVHLDKGCYRGQETVARVQNLGKPPRRLVLLHLSGDSEQLPAAGNPVERDGRTVGFVGTAAQHYELGPIALAVVKRGVSLDDALTVAGHAAALDPADAEVTYVEGFAGRAGPSQTSA